jgi:hypothetical protein
MVKKEGYGIKLSWSILSYYPKHLPGGAKENNKTPPVSLIE